MLARRDETRCVDCDLCLFATNIEIDGVRVEIYIARETSLCAHLLETH